MLPSWGTNFYLSPGREHISKNICSYDRPILCLKTMYLAVLYIFRTISHYLMNDCSNTTWSYSTSTFTISDRCIAVCKWWFFVWFVGENPDFPLCPCSFWEFCYHSVIADLSFINDNSLIIKFSYSISFLLENSYFIKIISSSKFKSTAGNILCI